MEDKACEKRAGEDATSVSSDLRRFFDESSFGSPQAHAAYTEPPPHLVGATVRRVRRATATYLVRNEIDVAIAGHEQEALQTLPQQATAGREHIWPLDSNEQPEQTVTQAGRQQRDGYHVWIDMTRHPSVDDKDEVSGSSGGDNPPRRTHQTVEDTVKARLGRHAFELAQDYLGVGRLDRARYWLTVAAEYDIDDADTLLTDVTSIQETLSNPRGTSYTTGVKTAVGLGSLAAEQVYAADLEQAGEDNKSMRIYAEDGPEAPTADLVTARGVLDHNQATEREYEALRAKRQDLIKLLGSLPDAHRNTVMVDAQRIIDSVLDQVLGWRGQQRLDGSTRSLDRDDTVAEQGRATDIVVGFHDAGAVLRWARKHAQATLREAHITAEEILAEARRVASSPYRQALALWRELATNEQCLTAHWAPSTVPSARKPRLLNTFWGGTFPRNRNIYAWIRMPVLETKTLCADASQPTHESSEDMMLRILGYMERHKMPDSTDLAQFWKRMWERNRRLSMWAPARHLWTPVWTDWADGSSTSTEQQPERERIVAGPRLRQALHELNRNPVATGN